MDALLMVALLIAVSSSGSSTSVQMDPEAQAFTDYDAADAAMTVQYRPAMARMRARDAPKTPDNMSFANSSLHAQRAWLPFRDSECLAEAFACRGPAPGPVDTQCKTRLTIERTRQLRAIAQ